MINKDFVLECLRDKEIRAEIVSVLKESAPKIEAIAGELREFTPPKIEITVRDISENN